MKKITLLDIFVTPKSSNSKIVFDDQKIIKVYLNSPPVDGKANNECVKLFAKKLRIAKSKIKIVKGAKGRNKRIEIEDLTFDDIIKRIKG